MRELTLNDVPDLLDEDYVATRSFNDLLAEGIPRKGGLAMLANAEREGTLFGARNPK